MEVETPASTRTNGLQVALSRDRDAHSVPECSHSGDLREKGARIPSSFAFL